MGKINLKEFNNELRKMGDNDGLTQEDLDDIEIRPPRRPHFPVFIFSLALLKDFGDVVSLGLLGTITNFLVSGIIWLWLIPKSSFIKKRLYKKIIFPVILEFIPFLDAFPATTFFVLRAHLMEYKKIDRIIKILEKIAEKI